MLWRKSISSWRQSRKRKKKQEQPLLKFLECSSSNGKKLRTPWEWHLPTSLLLLCTTSRLRAMRRIIHLLVFLMLRSLSCLNWTSHQHRSRKEGIDVIGSGVQSGAGNLQSKISTNRSCRSWSQLSQLNSQLLLIMTHRRLSTRSQSHPRSRHRRLKTNRALHSLSFNLYKKMLIFHHENQAWLF